MWSVFGNLNELQFAKLDLIFILQKPSIYLRYLKNTYVLRVWQKRHVCDIVKNVSQGNLIYNILSAHNEVFWW